MNSVQTVVFPLYLILVLCIVGGLTYIVMGPRPTTIVYREQPPQHVWDRRWGYPPMPWWRQYDGVPFPLHHKK